MKLDLRESIIIGAFVLIAGLLADTAVNVFESPVPVNEAAVSPTKPSQSVSQDILHGDPSYHANLSGGESTPGWQGTVQWSDIAVLANSVDIKADLAEVSGNSKGLDSAEREKWFHAMEHAKTLISGMCDCDQVNYLTHFIQCGQYAVNGNTKLTDALIELRTLKLEN